MSDFKLDGFSKRRIRRKNLVTSNWPGITVFHILINTDLIININFELLRVKSVLI